MRKQLLLLLFASANCFAQSVVVGTISGSGVAGTAAVKDTGTSGNRVPLLDNANTWSGTQTIGSTVITTGQAIGIVCAGNITTPLQAAIDSLAGASGGTISLSSGSCYSTAQITIATNNATPPHQASIRITGQGSSADGSWTAASPAATILDLRVVPSTGGKIETLGMGRLEIDHIDLIDTLDGTKDFIHTTFTTLRIHDVRFVGKTATTPLQDAIVLGGTTTSVTASGDTSAFQGYGTVIDSNFFDQIRRVVYWRTYANSVSVRDNTVSLTCGGTAAFEVLGAVAPDTNGGGTLMGNLIEVGHYVYGLKLANAVGFTLQANHCYDPTGSTLACVRFEATANDNLLITGFSSVLLDVSDANGLGAGSSNIRITKQAGTGNNLSFFQDGVRIEGFGASHPGLFADGSYLTVRTANNGADTGLEVGDILSSGNISGATVRGGVPINVQTGTSYTLVAADNGKVVTCNNAGAITVTVPAGLAVGFNVTLVQLGAGAVTPTASSTTIVQRQSLTKTAGVGAAISLFSHLTNGYILAGDLQ